MKVAISGAAGFVGSFLSNYFLSHGHSVYGIGRKGVSTLVFRHNKDHALFVPIEADCKDLKKTGITADVVIHAAARSPYNARGDEDYIHNNVDATRNMLRWAFNEVNAKLFFYLSAMSIYGNVTESVVDEETPIRSPDVYGRTKLQGEVLVQGYADRLPAYVLRLPGVVGPGAHTCWLARTRKLLCENQDVVLFNADNPFNNVLHLRSLASFILTLTQKKTTGTTVLTLGADDPMRLREVVDLMARFSNSTSRIRWRDDPRKSFIVSSERAKRLFQFSPEEVGMVVRDFCREEQKHETFS